MALASAGILYFCFGCLFVTSACLEITYSSSEMVDGDIFKTGSRVSFTCTHQPYQGIQKWIFDRKKFLDCGFLLCFDLTPPEDRFSCFNDINNGSFIFTIEHVELSDDGKIIECDDGSANKMFEMKVKEDITTSTLSTKSSTDLTFSTIRNRNSTASFQRKHIYRYVGCGVAGAVIVVLIMVYIYQRRRNLRLRPPVSKDHL